MRKIRHVIWFFALVWVMGGCASTQYVHVGPNWDALHQLDQKENDFKVQAKGPAEAALNETISFTVKSEKAGTLWVVQVDARDNTSIIFPNAYAAENRIPANTTVHIPPEGAHWNIAAGEPSGRSIVAFVVTQGDQDVGSLLRQPNGLSKALSVVSAAPGRGVDKIVINVKGKDEQ
jgi:hypothetical protein